MNDTPIAMIKDKDCKHSVRFAAKDEKAPIQSLYVSRELAGSWNELVITVREIGARADKLAAI